MLFNSTITPTTFQIGTFEARIEGCALSGEYKCSPCMPACSCDTWLSDAEILLIVWRSQTHSVCKHTIIQISEKFTRNLICIVSGFSCYGLEMSESSKQQVNFLFFTSFPVLLLKSPLHTQHWINRKGCKQNQIGCPFHTGHCGPVCRLHALLWYRLTGVVRC